MRRIMYVENKAGGLDGAGRVGWMNATEYSGGTHTRTAGKLFKDRRKPRASA